MARTSMRPCPHAVSTCSGRRLQRPLMRGGQQERLELLLRAAGGGLADEASHRGAQGAVAGAMYVAQGD